jgi:hypothetical protein
MGPCPECFDETPNEVALDVEFKWVAKDPEVQLDVAAGGSLRTSTRP